MFKNRTLICVHPRIQARVLKSAANTLPKGTEMSETSFRRSVALSLWC